MKEIFLTQGKIALVDDEYYDWLNQWKWHSARKCRRWYVMRGNNPPIYMHRVILKPPTGYECDHIDGNGLNNQRCNLRICTCSQNQQNKSPQRGGASRFKGVCWHKGNRSWNARISLNMRRIGLGYFGSELEAAQSYNDAAINYFGEFARINIIKGRSNGQQ